MSSRVRDSSLQLIFPSLENATRTGGPRLTFLCPGQSLGMTGKASGLVTGKGMGMHVHTTDERGNMCRIQRCEPLILRSPVVFLTSTPLLHLQPSLTILENVLSCIHARFVLAFFVFSFCLFLPTTTITRPSPIQLLRHTLTTSWCHPATWGCHPVGFANHLHSRPPTEAFIQHGVREPQGCLRIRLIMFWPCLHLFPLDCSRLKTLGSNRLMGKQVFFFIRYYFLVEWNRDLPVYPPPPQVSSVPPLFHFLGPGAAACL